LTANTPVNSVARPASAYDTVIKFRTTLPLCVKNDAEEERERGRRKRVGTMLSIPRANRRRKSAREYARERRRTRLRFSKAPI